MCGAVVLSLCVSLQLKVNPFRDGQKYWLNKSRSGHQNVTGENVNVSLQEPIGSSKCDDQSGQNVTMLGKPLCPNVSMHSRCETVLQVNLGSNDIPETKT